MIADRYLADANLAIVALAQIAQKYEDGIRAVRDDWVRGDHKCWKDLVAMFQLLPEGFTLPATDTRVELEYCKQYIESCHHPGVNYVSPQTRIEELEHALREAYHFIHKGIEVRMTDQWPALQTVLRHTLPIIEDALHISPKEGPPDNGH